MSGPPKTQLAQVSLKLILSFLFSASLGVFGAIGAIDWSTKNIAEWLGIFILFAGFYFICFYLYEKMRKKPTTAPSSSNPSYPIVSDMQSDIKEYQYAVSGIAHDFNNILTCISGNLSMALMDSKELAGTVKDYINDSLHAVIQASSLSDQLLRSSKGQDPIRENASLDELVQDSARFVLAGSGVSVEFSKPEKAIPPVKTDPTQISQVIQNLVLNAKQAMNNHGKIKISTEIVEWDNICQSSAIQANKLIKDNSQQFIRIAIADTGPGIDKKIQTRIFEPFFTTKKDGNGLGLANSRRIIEDHQGFLEFESKKGKGTTFYIYLPQQATA